MTPESVKTLTEIIALALGGAWAIFGLIVLKQREQARADLRKTGLETEKTQLEMRQLELELRRMAVVRAEISAASFRRPDGPGYCIIAQVSLTNTGGWEARIEWDDATPAFFVRRTSFGTDGAPCFTERPIELRARQARDANAEVVSTIIRPGASEHLAFAAHVQNLGLYLLSFRGPVAPRDRMVSVEAGAAKHNPTSWTAHRYIIVTESPSHETPSSPAV